MARLSEELQVLNEASVPKYSLAERVGKHSQFEPKDAVLGVLAHD